jgi:hypothetical protein
LGVNAMSCSYAVVNKEWFHMCAKLHSSINSKRLRFGRARLALALPAISNDWLATAIIVVTVIAVASIFLLPAPLEFPSDDTYIHFVYARNLSEHGRLFFNFPDEVGVGTSSLLWVLILSAGNWAGVSMHWIAKLVGVVSLAVIGIGLYYLLRPLFPSWVALVGALLVTLSGNMVWFSLSGMETVLFLALGILALLCYREERWGWLGLLLGLLIITRIEGVLLALAIGLFDTWRHQAIRRGLLVAGLSSLLICGPWFLYLWQRTGSLIPTSGQGKHYNMIASIQVAARNNGSWAWLSRFPGFAYLLTMIGYMIEFVLGGFALPAPYFYIDIGLGSFNFRLSLWAIIGLATVIFPLLWASFRQLARFLKTPSWLKDQVRLPLVILLAWMVLHNLCYLVYMPSIGTASRYNALNHIVLWLALLYGLWFMRQSRFKLWLVSGLLIIALANTLYWNRVYDANIEHMLKVRIAAANYLREQIPASETCAASDIGALRYYSQRPIIDLLGLIDPGLRKWYMADKSDQYLLENRVTCLVLPGRAGTSADGVFDVAKELGFTGSSLFELQQVKVFEIDRQRWLFGYLPTTNAQATITIYYLVEE